MTAPMPMPAPAPNELANVTARGYPFSTGQLQPHGRQWLDPSDPSDSPPSSR